MQDAMLEEYQWWVLIMRHEPFLNDLMRKLGYSLAARIRFPYLISTRNRSEVLRILEAIEKTNNPAADDNDRLVVRSLRVAPTKECLP